MSFKIVYQLFCAGHDIQVTYLEKDKTKQVVGKLPEIPLGTSNFNQTYGIAEKKY
jgi:hypothetical protein